MSALYKHLKIDDKHLLINQVVLISRMHPVQAIIEGRSPTLGTALQRNIIRIIQFFFFVKKQQTYF